ncbi:hypothetical protein HQ550_02030 [bacterium]|nr:hypothetical protein [bacterium]
MKNRAEALIFFVIFLLIFSLGIAGFYFISYKYERKTRRESEEQLAFIKDEKERIERRIEKLGEEKETLEEKIKQNDELIPKLKEKLEREIQTKELLMSEHESLEDEILQFKKENKETKSALLIKIQELTQLQNRLNAAVLERNELRAKISELTLSRNNSEDLDKIIVTPSDSNNEIKILKSPLSTEVLVVNREYGFLILNVGRPDDVERGDVFEILHRGVSIGKVRVEKIHDTISAADFLEGFKKKVVSDGDVANRIN